MHRTKILRTLVAASLFLSVTASATAKVDVYEEFQKKIDLLEKDLSKEKDISRRYDLFLKAHKNLSELRAKNPRQAEEKELDMSLFMDALVSLPEKKSFQAKKCADYQKEVQDSMKSYAKDQKEPFVDKAFRIVKAICQK